MFLVLYLPTQFLSQSVKLDNDLQVELRKKYHHFESSELDKIDQNFYEYETKSIDKLYEDIKNTEEDVNRQKTMLTQSARRIELIDKNLKQYKCNKIDSTNYSVLMKIKFSDIKPNKKLNRILKSLPPSDKVLYWDKTRLILLNTGQNIKFHRIYRKNELKCLDKSISDGSIVYLNSNQREQIIYQYTGLNSDFFQKRNKLELDRLKYLKDKRYSKLLYDSKSRLLKKLKEKQRHYQKYINYIQDRKVFIQKQQWNDEEEEIQRMLIVKAMNEEQEKILAQEEEETKRKIAEKQSDKKEIYKSYNSSNSNSNNSLNKGYSNITNYVKTRTFRKGNFKINFYANGWVVFKSDRGQYYGTEMKGIWDRYGSNAIQITNFSFVSGYFDASNNPKLNGVFYLQSNGSLSGDIGDYSGRINWTLSPQ